VETPIGKQLVAWPPNSVRVTQAGMPNGDCTTAPTLPALPPTAPLLAKIWAAVTHMFLMSLYRENTFSTSSK